MASAHGDRMTGDCNLRKHSEQRFCCGGCGRAFSSMEPFDWHRIGHVCTDPATSKHQFSVRTVRGVVGDVTVWGRSAPFQGRGPDRESQEDAKGYPDEGSALPEPLCPGEGLS